jgi:hypothetical protein
MRKDLAFQEEMLGPGSVIALQQRRHLITYSLDMLCLCSAQ